MTPDAPGFDLVQDEATSWPIRKKICLLFLPGRQATFSVDGRAGISFNPAHLDAAADAGKPARAVIVVRVEAGRWQCREKPTHGRLWGPSQRILKGSLPSLARTINDQVAELGEAETAQRLAESCRDRLY